MSMAQWQALLLEPDDLGEAHPAWFAAVARRLLCGSRLLAAGVPHRFTEVEFYYHGGVHPDPFTHRDPVQRGTGLWYFHRTHGVYRGGSFKGFDLTFGGPGAFGGVLVRGLEPEGGGLIDGPCLCVDHLLARTQHATVAQRDEAVAGRPAWDPASPLHLRWLDEMEDRPVVQTARVGLSLKKLRKAEVPPRYLLRPYRFLSEPRRITKGKLHLVLALHAAGKGPAEIREQTGCTKAALDRYTADYQAGLGESDFGPYFGIDLGPKELARLHGVSQAKFGRRSEG
jgi:3-methyladenine DNA glycosylase Mpg